MNLQEIKGVFEECTQEREGILGVASFENVYNNLMPIQQKKLLEIGSGESLIVFGIFHSQEAIESINIRKNGRTDYEAWNQYAREYHTLNAILDRAARSIAAFVHGIPIPATIEGIASKIQRIEDYYALTVSQRVGAEYAGLGWRGKNELIVTTHYGCAVRFASVICPVALPAGTQMKNYCGDCIACLTVCPFLRKKDVLQNYREQCRRFIAALKLEGDVCGKCVKACYEHWTDRQ
jgi:epoxyqueuosine reductase QueG